MKENDTRCVLFLFIAQKKIIKFLKLKVNRITD